MPRASLIVAALLAFAPGAHAADLPPAERGETRRSPTAMTLLCWQAGRIILEERDIIAISPVGRGMAFYRRDGSHLQLLSNDHRLTFCFLDLPKDLPDQPLATEASR